MNLQRDDMNHTGILILEGELNIQRAGELKNLLMRSLEFGEPLLLNAEKVTGADVSCLQVLCSAHRISMKSGRRLTLQGRLSEPLSKAADDAGYRRERSCMHGQQDCLWVTGVPHE